MKKEEIIQILRENKTLLAQRYSVHTIGLFGSYVRGEATENSDIDIVVDMPSSFDNFFDLKYFLEEKFQTKVDLTKEKNLRPFIKDKIQSELLYA